MRLSRLRPPVDEESSTSGLTANGVPGTRWSLQIGARGVVRRSALSVSFPARQPAQGGHNSVAEFCCAAVTADALCQRQQVCEFAAAAILNRKWIPQYRLTSKLVSCRWDCPIIPTRVGILSIRWTRNRLLHEWPSPFPPRARPLIPQLFLRRHASHQQPGTDESRRCAFGDSPAPRAGPCHNRRATAESGRQAPVPLLITLPAAPLRMPNASRRRCAAVAPTRPAACSVTTTRATARPRSRPTVRSPRNSPTLSKAGPPTYFSPGKCRRCARAPAAK
jgi:hypothetical protein